MGIFSNLFGFENKRSSLLPPQTSSESNHSGKISLEEWARLTAHPLGGLLANRNIAIGGRFNHFGQNAPSIRRPRNDFETHSLVDSVVSLLKIGHIDTVKFLMKHILEND